MKMALTSVQILRIRVADLVARSWFEKCETLGHGQILSWECHKQDGDGPGAVFVCVKFKFSRTVKSTMPVCMYLNCRESSAVCCSDFMASDVQMAP